MPQDSVIANEGFRDYLGLPHGMILPDPEVPLWVLLREAGERHADNGSGFALIGSDSWRQMAAALESGAALKALTSGESPLKHLIKYR